MTSAIRNARSGSEDPDHLVAVIGAGLTGIGAAKALLEADITDFVVLERADDVGGTWRDHTYPGVGVDVPTFAYQFSYFLKPDWSRLFAKGHEVKEYIDDFVDHFGIKPHVRFGVDVTTKTWDDDAHLWRLATADGGEITARFVIFAVGAYIERRPPSFAGLDDYRGKVLDPTYWDHDYDPAGKRIAIVGTGATAVQIVPQLAAVAEQLDVYQRTPIYCLPKVDPTIPKFFVNAMARSRRVALAGYYAANVLAELTLIKTIMRYAKVPWLQRFFECISLAQLRLSVRDRRLRSRLKPPYPFGGKRPAMSNDYWPTFTRPHVDLVTDRIDTFTETGIRTVDGAQRDVDAVVLATGYRMAYDPAAYRDDTRITGRDGFDLGQRFATDRLKAYEGLTMPGLPNFFMAFCGYSAVGGSWHPLIENMGRHVVRVINECERRGVTSAEISPEATDRFHAMITERMEPVLMYHRDISQANSYYLDHHGDATVMRPTSIKQAREASATFPLDDYHYSALPTDETAGSKPSAAATNGEKANGEKVNGQAHSVTPTTR